MASCGSDARCYVRHDGPLTGFTGTLSTSLLHVLSGAVTPVVTAFPASLPRGGGALLWTCAGSGSPGACANYTTILRGAGCATDGSDCILLVELRSTAGADVDISHELLTIPGNMKLPRAAVTAVVLDPAPDATSATVQVTTDAPALYVTLTTLAQGRFSKNAVLLRSNSTLDISFVAFGELDVDLLRSTLVVEYVNKYLHV